jgi:hypothetical protein
VHLLCQDRDAGSLDWVDEVGRWDDWHLEVAPAPGVGGAKREKGAGTVTVYTPDISGLLPVYVSDRYEGFRVKTFGEMGPEELSLYLKANVVAVRDVVWRAGGVDAALANHVVMGPAILARAGFGEEGRGYAVKIHGSALEFTVKRDPERFLPYAREGLAGASTVLVGSRHTAEAVWETLRDDELPLKTRLGPPGVDVERFAPLDAVDAQRDAGDLAREVAAGRVEGGFGRDTAAAASALEAYAGARRPFGLGRRPQRTSSRAR